MHYFTFGLADVCCLELFCCCNDYDAIWLIGFFFRLDVQKNADVV